MVEGDRLFSFLCSFPLFILFISFVRRSLGRRRLRSPTRIGLRSPTRIDCFNQGQGEVMKILLLSARAEASRFHGPSGRMKR